IITLILLLGLGGGIGAQTYLLQARLDEMGKASTQPRSERASAELNRIQSQNAALSASMDLLHKDIAQLLCGAPRAATSPSWRPLAKKPKKTPGLLCFPGMGVL
ncbi:MAG: hypothetical protein QGF53_15485, partial [Alphaproteobacteria bacterium]|nr:hypothetical protein [Alphaproteobacteria bacterium]